MKPDTIADTFGGILFQFWCEIEMPIFVQSGDACHGAFLITMTTVSSMEAEF